MHASRNLVKEGIIKTKMKNNYTRARNMTILPNKQPFVLENHKIWKVLRSGGRLLSLTQKY